jgi:ankyrin repeat protein
MKRFTFYLVFSIIAMLSVAGMLSAVGPSSSSGMTPSTHPEYTTPDSFTSAVADAIRIGDLAMLQDLISKGADVNFKSADENFPPIVIASILGKADAVKVLIDNKAIVDNTDLISGNTALAYAVLRSNSDIIKALLDAGADPNKKNSGMISPTELAFATGSKSLDLLRAKGGTVDIAAISSYYEFNRDYKNPEMASGLNTEQAYSATQTSKK